MLNSWEKFHSMKSMENWIGEVHFIPFLSITGCSVFVLSEAQPVFIGVPWQGSILGLVLFIIHFNVHIVLQFSKVSNFCHICQCIITYIHYYMHYYLIRCMEWDAISVFVYLIAKFQTKMGWLRVGLLWWWSGQYWTGYSYI